MADSISERVKNLVAGILDIPADSLTPSTGVGDIPQWDSLAQVAIVTTMEDDFGLDLDADSLMEVSTLADLIALAEGQNGETSPEAPTDSKSATRPTAPSDFRSIENAICRVAESSPAKTALIFETESITYHQLKQGMYTAAAWLAEHGISGGDAVALAAERRKEFFYTYFGAHLLGATVLNLDTEIKPERLAYITDFTHPKLQIGVSLQSATHSYEEIPVLPPVAPAAPAPQPPAKAIADIMFTTGTTGDPKGVPLTHANLAAAADQINRFIGTTADDIEVIALPICHSFGMGRVRCVLSVGGTAVLVSGFSNIKRLHAALEDYRATGFAFVPAAWAYLQKMSGDATAEHASHLRYIEIGSAPMAEETRRHLMQLFPHTRICMHYGLTEASRSSFIEFHSEAAHLCSAGRPSPGVEIAIFTPQGERMSADAEGEICVKGSHVTSGYLGQAAQESRFGDFFRTGDWGMLDGDGYLHVLSRTKDIINTGGKKVSPDEIEGILCAMPGITEAACVPAPDPQGILGEVVKAVLVSDGSPRPNDETVRAHVAARAEHYKVPVLIEWRDSLVKTDSGKLRRSMI